MGFLWRLVKTLFLLYYLGRLLESRKRRCVNICYASHTPLKNWSRSLRNAAPAACPRTKSCGDLPTSWKRWNRISGKWMGCCNFPCCPLLESLPVSRPYNKPLWQQPDEPVEIRKRKNEKQFYLHPIFLLRFTLYVILIKILFCLFFIE